MKSIIIAALAVLMLASCDESDHASEEVAVAPASEIKMNMPTGLSDCKTFFVTGKPPYDSVTMLVTRCPHSTTTTKAGPTTAVVADDEEAQ